MRKKLEFYKENNVGGVSNPSNYMSTKFINAAIYGDFSSLQESMSHDAF